MFLCLKNFIIKDKKQYIQYQMMEELKMIELGENLVINGVNKIFLTHRLVAETFFSEPK